MPRWTEIKGFDMGVRATCNSFVWSAAKLLSIQCPRGRLEPTHPVQFQTQETNGKQCECCSTTTGKKNVTVVHEKALSKPAPVIFLNCVHHWQANMLHYPWQIDKHHLAKSAPNKALSRA